MPAMFESAQPAKREELDDEIYNVEAAETPFLSSINRKGKKPNQMICQWVAEAYPVAALTGIVDGTDVSTYNSTSRSVIEGVSQWFRYPWMVAKLASLTNAAGVGRDEAGHQATLALMTLKRMMEARFCGTGECQVESGATPYETRGAFLWVQNSEQSLKPVPAAFRPSSSCAYTSAVASFTESMFMDMLIAAYASTKSALNWRGFVGRDLRKVMDLWTARDPTASTTAQPTKVYDAGKANQVSTYVDRFVFSVGVVTSHLTPHLAIDEATGADTAYTPKSGLFIVPKMWDVAFMQPIAVERLQDLGGGPRGYVDAVGVLRCKNPLGSCYVLTNS